MTDEQIIEALKRCPQHRECCYCNSIEECGNKRILTTSVFDLINRQKAEIINRTEEYNDMLEQRNKCKAEIERLKDKIFVLENDLEKAENLSNALGNDVDIKLNYIYDLEEKLKKAKSEVIKEFAERLKDEMRLEDDCRYDCMNCLYECKGYVPLIDNLVKEMTEE